MAADYFLKIEGIEGESRDAKHQKQVDVLSWSWGASQLASPGTDPGLDAKDFVYVARVSKASPLLMLRCATGKHIPKVELTVRKSPEDRGDYYTIKMRDVLVSSFQHHGEDGSVPLEEISMKFAGADFQYSQVSRSGQLGPPFATGDIPDQSP